MFKLAPGDLNLNYSRSDHALRKGGNLTPPTTSLPSGFSLLLHKRRVLTHRLRSQTEGNVVGARKRHG
jgi:hypothetical protein